MRKAPAKEPETVQKIWGVNQLSVQPSQSESNISILCS